ncbi:MAG: hypothetical protein H0U76_28680 [Ktedonobacteraceae bacterium]|nr:hypothetical protein [Ktedonobacteraceae bacterium]
MEALEFLALVVPFLIMIYFACLLFIRPPRRLFWRSLLAGLVVGLVNLIVDILAYQAHWWQYTFAPVALQRGVSPVQLLVADLFAQSMSVLHVPLPFYLTPILIFGSLAFLLIWRFWYGRGHWFSLLLLIGTPVFCIVRDILGGVQKTSYQVWENVPVATVVTIGMWLLAFYLGFWIFWRAAASIEFEPLTHSTSTQRSTKKQEAPQS